MIKDDKIKQFSTGKKMNVLGITIHNTGNELSAKENYDLMLSGKYEAGTHVFVDEKEAIQVLSYDVNCWHTGKAFDKGNMNTISIEICRSVCDEETYLKAQANAIKLVVKLMKKYKLTKEQIYFHQDFDQKKYCPHRILTMYGTKNNFIEKELI